MQPINFVMIYCVKMLSLSNLETLEFSPSLLQGGTKKPDPFECW